MIGSGEVLEQLQKVLRITWAPASLHMDEIIAEEKIKRWIAS